MATGVAATLQLAAKKGFVSTVEKKAKKPEKEEVPSGRRDV